MEVFRSICSFLSAILGVYSTLILIRIIVSWVLLFSRRNGWRSGNGGYGYNQEDPNNPSGIAMVDQILGKICDPYLNLFRNVKGLRRSTVDFTPLLAFVLISLARTILSLVSQAYKLTVWVVLAIIIDGLWSAIVSFLLILTIILLVVRFFVGRSNSANTNNIINMIDPILDRPVGRVYKLFFRKARVDDQKLVIASLIFYVVVYFVLKWGVQALVNFLISL